MKKSIIAPILLVASLSPHAQTIETAFSPEAGAEALVLKVIGSAHKSIRLAAYSFTSPTIVRALLDAKKRGVDVQAVIDEKDNIHAAKGKAALNLLAEAGIPTRTISAYAIHHDKYMIIDGETVETGSFNYTAAATKKNSENVIVVWHDPKVAADYLAHWQSRFQQGVNIGVGKTH